MKLISEVLRGFVVCDMFAAAGLLRLSSRVVKAQQQGY
jgi:hypothetical protein